jgi:hypothetical protein
VEWTLAAGQRVQPVSSVRPGGGATSHPLRRDHERRETGTAPRSRSPRPSSARAATQPGPRPAVGRRRAGGGAPRRRETRPRSRRRARLAPPPACTPRPSPAWSRRRRGTRTRPRRRPGRPAGAAAARHGDAIRAPGAGRGRPLRIDHAGADHRAGAAAERRDRWRQPGHATGGVPVAETTGATRSVRPHDAKPGTPGAPGAPGGPCLSPRACCPTVVATARPGRALSAGEPRGAGCTRRRPVRSRRGLARSDRSRRRIRLAGRRRRGLLAPGG